MGFPPVVLDAKELIRNHLRYFKRLYVNYKFTAYLKRSLSFWSNQVGSDIGKISLQVEVIDDPSALGNVDAVAQRLQ